MDRAYNETVTNKQALSPPDVWDIRDTKTLLRDFCIIKKIPKFKTLNRLLAWRSKQIVEKLSQS